MDIRIGQGIDFHQLIAGTGLKIGGVEIPHHKKALGHSDADVLLHAICDALLGAVALGDIGIHFPNTDPSYKDIDSKLLLLKTFELIDKLHYRVGNIDATILLEMPKIAPYIQSMQTVIAAILKVEPTVISIKATTTEKLGFIGKEEGIAALANVILFKKI